MAHVKSEEVFKCPAEGFFKVITDYENYPDFLAEVKSTQILKTESKRKLVEFSISLIKNFKYRLWMEEEAPYKLKWYLESGEVFKSMNGSWVLKKEANRTRAFYEVDVSFQLFVPGPIANALVQVNLPNMMSSYHERVREVYGS